MALDRSLFYKELRKKDNTVFGTTLSDSQFAGLEADLNEAERRGLPLEQVAAILAEDAHETGRTMQPISENLNYSVNGLLSTFRRTRISAADANRLGRKKGEGALSQARQREIANIIYGGAWGKKNLGNTQPNDGWDMRGRGKVQITGRANYDKYGLAETPDAAKDMEIAAHILFDGMLLGKFRNRKLSSYVGNGKKDYAGSRQCVNPDGNGPEIAKYAINFEKALRAAGYSASAQTQPAQPTAPTNPKPAPAPTPAPVTDKIYTDATTVEVVQRRLWELGYTEVGSRRPDGSFDGKLGSMSRAAILLFRNDNGLPVSDVIDTEFLEALDHAPARKLARNDAPPAVVRQNAPEVQSNFVNKILAVVTGGGLTLGGVANEALDTVKPWRDMLADIPSWVWFGAGIGICVMIYLIAARGEKKGVEAYQSGERR